MNGFNRYILQEKINHLLEKSVYTCLEVYSKGNKIYFLNDKNSRIYILLVPSKPLDKIKSQTLLNFGFKEIWPFVNYEKSVSSIDENELNNLSSDIEKIIKDIFKIDPSRTLRFEYNSGIAALKNNSTPLLTSDERRNRNKQSKGNLKLNYDLFYACIVSVFIIILMKIYRYEMSFIILLIVYPTSLLLVRMAKIISKLNILLLRKRWFLGKGCENYFNQKGFIKAGERYIGIIQGYRTEFLFSKYSKFLITVYHEQISWEKVLEMPKTPMFSSFSYKWTGMFYSQKALTSVLSKGEIIHEANDFVELLMTLNINRPIK